MKTHTTGTLRSNRKRNPPYVIKQKLKKGEHVWKRNQSGVYVSKWKDKRDVVTLTTGHPVDMLDVVNRRGESKKKPKHIYYYNKYMSGIDRSDQFLAYYSCPRKTVRWYKKVLCHIFDIAVSNAFYLYRIGRSKLRFIQFRERLIQELLDLPTETKGQFLISTSPLERKQHTPTAHQHYLEDIPTPANWKRNAYYLLCQYCKKDKKKVNTRYRCKTCCNLPALCPAPCFEKYHLDL